MDESHWFRDLDATFDEDREEDFEKYLPSEVLKKYREVKKEYLETGKKIDDEPTGD